MSAILLEPKRKVKIEDSESQLGSPNGGVPQGTLSGPKNFLAHINDLSTPCPIYKYVDDSTIFEICTPGSVSALQESADIATQWSKDNDMRVNASKTQEPFIDFSRNNIHCSVEPHIVIDDLVKDIFRF